MQRVAESGIMDGMDSGIGNIDNKAIITLLAHSNLRGIKSSDIVCEIQDLREKLESEPLGEHRFYLLCRFNWLLNELERRTRMNNNGVRVTNKEIIQTIKERIDIDTVLAWYTDVFYHQNKWTYRCTLHGDDKHPSGVIYKDDNRFHCFVCQAHGDIFDAVQLFERLELIEAIKKLANFIGLEIKPFEKHPTDTDGRLRQLELKLNHTLKVNPPPSPLTKRYIYNRVKLDDEK